MVSNGSNIEKEVDEQNQIQEQQSFDFDADLASGEAALGSIVLKKVTQNIVPGPGKVIGTSFKSLFASIVDTCKKPVKLIPAIVLVVLWLTISILQASGINPLPVKILSFLTFAEAGLHGGIIGAVGGIIGKGLFACAVVIIISLFKKKNKCEKRSLKETIHGSFGFSLNTLFVFLVGIGVAMLFYLFISGGATKRAFMGGMAVMLLAALSALNGGFIPNIINAFTSKGKTKASEAGVGFTRGLALGFIISAFVGLIGINLILIITGLVLVVVGIVFIVLQKTGSIKLGKEEKNEQNN